MSAALPELDTARLRLRVPRVADAGGYAAYLERNREHFRDSTPARGERDFEPSRWAEAFARLEPEIAARRAVTFLIWRDGGLVGDVSITGVIGGVFCSGYLGYKLDRDHQGQGLMSEAVAAVIDFAFTEWNLHRLSANYRPENTRSGQLLRRLGFAVEGYARDYLRLDGRWCDHVLCAKLNEGWQSDSGG